jgi:hypothetical protein
MWEVFSGCEDVELALYVTFAAFEHTRYLCISVKTCRQKCELPVSGCKLLQVFFGVCTYQNLKFVFFGVSAQ